MVEMVLRYYAGHELPWRVVYLMYHQYTGRFVGEYEHECWE